MKFVDVILPLPLPAAYTYALPEERQEVVRERISKYEFV